MSIKRVQKLLFSEYCDFEDMVLIESPFAQTTREGTGLRQVHLGLTPSKLVLATDVLPPVEKSCVEYLAGVDPDIETFELIAIYPTDCVNLSVFRRRKRQAIKAHFCNNKVFYFELGGFENRTMFWNLWCEKIKFLSPESGSSNSETSVGTSSTNSTLYLVDSKQVVKPNGLTQVWCKFGKDEPSNLAKWTDRYLYLGKKFEEEKYKPMMKEPTISEFVKKRKFSLSKHQTSEFREVHIGDSCQIERFGSGVKENCSTGLFLPAENYIVPRRFSQISDQSSVLYDELASKSFENVLEDCVRFWEIHTNLRQSRKKHKRRYGIAPHPLFLYGLGPWNINTGARFSIQVKRAVSEVGIRRQPSENEMRLPVAKRQLVATISCETLLQDETIKNTNIKCGGPRRPVIFFWTPDYWYRPRSARDAYLELQNHLKGIQDYHQKIKKRRRLFRRRPPPRSESSDTETDHTPKYQKFKKRKTLSRFNFNGRGHVCDVALCCLLARVDEDKSDHETNVQYLKRLLKVTVVQTAWDFDSNTLAQQLTMIDRDLFLKISGLELAVLVSQQSSKNAPNIAAMVAFSHRISCLVASDILKSNNSERVGERLHEKLVKLVDSQMRARLTARFIAVAEKCHRISNFQSCRTVLLGLQSPAIYRLKKTWAYVRKKHASKYQSFEFLCRLYRDPRLLKYQKTFFLSSQTMPYLPFIGDVIAKLLDRIPEYRMKATKVVASSPKLSAASDSGVFTKLLMSMKLINFNNCGSDSEVNECKSRDQVLCYRYKPLDCYEDNRMKCLNETTEFLQKCQLSALNYNFGAHKLAMDYLLKARYKEEKENFFDSFRVEPVDNV